MAKVTELHSYEELQQLEKDVFKFQDVFDKRVLAQVIDGTVVARQLVSKDYKLPSQIIDSGHFIKAYYVDPVRLYVIIRIDETEKHGVIAMTHHGVISIYVFDEQDNLIGSSNIRGGDLQAAIEKAKSGSQITDRYIDKLDYALRWKEIEREKELKKQQKKQAKQKQQDVKQQNAEQPESANTNENVNQESVEDSHEIEIEEIIEEYESDADTDIEF